MMVKFDVVCVIPVRVPQHLWEATRDAVLGQVSERVRSLRIVAMDDNDHYDVLRVVSKVGKGREIVSVLQPPERGDDRYATISEGRVWDSEAVHRLAYMRDSLIREARRGHTDYLWMLDADLVPAPDTLDKLMAQVPVNMDRVAYGVFWTTWPGVADPLPQVWDRHPYGSTTHTIQALTEERRGGVKGVFVAGGGACTLVPWRVYRHPWFRYSPAVRGLPLDGMWQGEDRSMALRLCVREVEQLAVSGVNIWHAYGGDQRTVEAVQAGSEAVRSWSYGQPPALHEWWAENGKYDDVVVSPKSSVIGGRSTMR